MTGVTRSGDTRHHTALSEAYVLFWDIDGTLLTTGRAGILAWEAAIRGSMGVECDLSEHGTSGGPRPTRGPLRTAMCEGQSCGSTMMSDLNRLPCRNRARADTGRSSSESHA